MSKPNVEDIDKRLEQFVEIVLHQIMDVHKELKDLKKKVKALEKASPKKGD